MAFMPLSVDTDELIDFESFSPYDRFSADAEIIFCEWKLGGDEIPSPPAMSVRIPAPAAGWDSPMLAAPIWLEKRRFSLQFHVDNQVPTNPLEAAPLQRLVGTHVAILLAAHANDEIVGWDAGDAHALLSALTIAMASANVRLPLFVPVGRVSRFRLIGKQLGSQCARFCSHVQAYVPETLQHMHGLLSLFASKRADARRGRRKPRPTDANISAKFSYSWKDFSLQVPNTPRNDLSPAERLANTIESSLSEHDPVKKFCLVALWDKFDANLLRDGSMRAAAADRIRVTIELNQKAPPPGVTPLASATRACLRLALRAGAEISPFGAPAAQKPLVKSVSRRLSLSSRSEDFSTTKARFLADARHILATASIEHKNLEIVYITAALSALLDPGADVDVTVSAALGPLADTQTTLERLARLIGALHDVQSTQLLWALFVDSVELHWNARVPFPGFGERGEHGNKTPNLYDNLLAQKLQMINCCIEREARNERDLHNMDEFGRKKVIEGIQLINAGGVVWEPNVQVSAIVTRDIVEAEQDRLVAGGGGGEEETRTLRSDMAAFKKANPDAEMSDFVRWFSPADWLEDESEKESDTADGWDVGSLTDEGAAWELSPDTKSLIDEEFGDDQDVDHGEGRKKPTKRKGRMSARMRKPGNEWEVLWNESEPTAAHEQTPLFDTTLHAAKALQDVREMTLSAALIHMGCSVGMEGGRLLVESMDLPNVKRGCEEARAQFRTLSSTVPMVYTEAAALRSDAAQMNEAVTLLERAEIAALKSMSLRVKMPDTTEELRDAMDFISIGRGAVLKGRLEKGLVARIANLDDEADWKEAAIAPHNRELLISDGNDRMYARLCDDEFRTAFRLSLDFGV